MNGTESREQEVDLQRVRDTLVASVAVPLGMTSRLEAGVLRSVRGDWRVGWEPRLAVACIVFAFMGNTPSAMTSGPWVWATALIALAYVWLVNAPAPRWSRRKIPGRVRS
ncbi:MAG: hypothetical protein ABJE47_08450 [bacterium]